MGHHQLIPGLRIGPIPLGWHHDRAAGAQRAENVEDRQIEAQRAEGQAAIPLVEAEIPPHAFQHIHRAAMFDRHAFRGTGRSRGENDIGQAVGPGIQRRQALFRQRQLRRQPCGIQFDQIDLGAGPGRIAEQRIDAGLRHHVQPPLRRPCCLHRQKRLAAHQRRQQGYRLPAPLVGDDGDGVTGHPPLHAQLVASVSAAACSSP